VGKWRGGSIITTSCSCCCMYWRQQRQRKQQPRSSGGGRSGGGGRSRSGGGPACGRVLRLREHQEAALAPGGEALDGVAVRARAAGAVLGAALEDGELREGVGRLAVWEAAQGDVGRPGVGVGAARHEAVAANGGVVQRREGERERVGGGRGGVVECRRVRRGKLRSRRAHHRAMCSGKNV
jgi:hypothetical protein